ncbi:MAG: histidine--tRNA ligase [Rhodoferax sp.]
MSEPAATPQKIEKILAVKGMNDVLPPASAQVEWLEAKVRALMARYAYRNIRTPIVEKTPLFVRGLGSVTDIVEKEMYCFEDRLNGDPLTLRPEATAGVVRAALEHNLLYDGGKRLYYMGPMFRHERPQKGRYRQFDQIGAEALGFSGPEVDAELMLMAHALWQELGLTDLRLEINSLGQPNERLAHRQALVEYFETHRDQLDEDAQRRLYSNPLRILDTKNPRMQALVEGAPQLLSFLGEASRAHLQAVLDILRASGVSYHINPRLVRGLDYYNLTVFEFVTDQLGAQATVCAGGRYDYLFEQLGGKPAPAVGWALGVDRVLELVRARCAFDAPIPDAYAIVMHEQRWPQVMAVLQRLRQRGVSVQMHACTEQGLGSLKSQFKRADASGARYALVFGEDELSAGEVSLKPLRQTDAPQRRLALADVDQWAASLQCRD